MIGETVRFARDEGHGLQVRDEMFTDFRFSRQLEPSAEHEIGMF
jgi:hypothetical protein